MLVPFHYFGIVDFSIDYEERDDFSLFGRLVSEERVRHIIEKTRITRWTRRTAAD